MTHTWLRKHKFLSYAISRHIFRVSLHQVRDLMHRFPSLGLSLFVIMAFDVLVSVFAVFFLPVL